MRHEIVYETDDLVVYEGEVMVVVEGEDSVGRDGDVLLRDRDGDEHVAEPDALSPYEGSPVAPRVPWCRRKRSAMRSVMVETERSLTPAVVTFVRDEELHIPRGIGERVVDRVGELDPDAVDCDAVNGVIEDVIEEAYDELSLWRLNFPDALKRFAVGRLEDTLATPVPRRIHMVREALDDVLDAKRALDEIAPRLTILANTLDLLSEGADPDGGAGLIMNVAVCIDDIEC